MATNATPQERKRVENRRERKPTRPARTQFENDDEPTKVAQPPIQEELIEQVTKDDPAATRQPSLQKEPPRAPGP